MATVLLRIAYRLAGRLERPLRSRPPCSHASRFAEACGFRNKHISLRHQVREDNKMPDIKTDDGCMIHVEVEGNLHMWDEQVGPFTRHLVPSEFDSISTGARSGLPPGALRPARPRQIGRTTSRPSRSMV
jgi:hypothetical protein